MGEQSLRDQVSQLVNIGIALTSTRSLDELLEQIVKEARMFTHCDGGSLYLVEDNHLRFAVAQNDTLDSRGIDRPARSSFSSAQIPIDNNSMAGYVANTGNILNIEDAYDLSPEDGFTINKEFDDINEYRTKSLLLVPMKNREGKIIGVLQLINALGPCYEVVEFHSSCEELVQAMASQAAVAVRLSVASRVR